MNNWLITDIKNVTDCLPVTFFNLISKLLLYNDLDGSFFAVAQNLNYIDAFCDLLHRNFIAAT